MGRAAHQLWLDPDQEMVLLILEVLTKLVGHPGPLGGQGSGQSRHKCRLNGWRLKKRKRSYQFDHSRGTD